MKKIVVSIMLAVVCALSICALVGCNKKGSATANNVDITGITFEDATYTYDGTEKSILVTGELPEGVVVKYTNNKGTNAGTYNAEAKLTGKGYNALSLSATLNIGKADITGVSIENETSYYHDGEDHLPTITGVIPQGVTAKYYFNDVERTGVNALGTYAVKVVLGGTNYNDLELNGTLKIKLNLLSLAETVVDSFGAVPEPWSFLPNALSVENRVLSAQPDYSDFIDVSSIPLNGIGKQLNVVYGVLNKTTTALSYVNRVYAVLNTVKQLYSEFLDNDPEDYKNFSATAGGLSFSLALTDDQYAISVNIGPVGITVYSDVENKGYGANVHLNSSTVLNYVVTENGLLIDMNILNVSATQVEFVRKDNNVVGYMYEYIVLGDKTLTATSAMITVDDKYTTLIGTKGDFIPTAVSRNCEVYRNSDGNLVGTEVREELTISAMTATYNTLWYPLANIGGITSIKKEDKMNGVNADTIYINGKADTIHTTLVGISNVKKSTSRRYDIEFKTMYFYEYDSDNEEYKEVTCEVPMMFIQEEQVSSFEADFKKSNSITVTLNVSSEIKQAVNYGYYTLLTAYDIIKDAVTYEKIVAACK